MCSFKTRAIQKKNHCLTVEFHSRFHLASCFMDICFSCKYYYLGNEFSYRVFSRDVTAAMFVYLNNGKAAMFVYPSNSPGIELCYHANVFFCLGGKTSLLYKRKGRK